MKVGVANIKALNQSLVCDNFDSKLQEFNWKVMAQVVGILTPFLLFNGS
jgi:hypothetical protein